jgi:Transposase IS66 family
MRKNVAKLRLDCDTPALAALRLWLDEMAPQALPKGALAAAIGNTLRHWAALERCL